MRALDLFCGLGGWSDGLAQVGFDVTGVDIIDVGYKHKLILADVRFLHPSQFEGYDVIVGSPPCRDFSRLYRPGLKYWKDPPDPHRGLRLVYEFLRIARGARPKIWLMENIDRLGLYLILKPRMVVTLGCGRKRGFWGDFPLFLVPFDTTVIPTEKINGPYRSWERARIPLPTALSFARACRDYLLKTEVNSEATTSRS